MTRNVSLDEQIALHMEQRADMELAKQADTEGWNAGIEEAIRQCEQMIVCLKALLK